MRRLKRRILLFICLPLSVVLLLSVGYIILRPDTQSDGGDSTNTPVITDNTTSDVPTDAIVSDQAALGDALPSYGISAESVPVIEWSTQNAALVTYRAPTSGYSLVDISSQVSGTEATVTMQLTRPGEGCIVTQGFQTVATVVVVPKTVTDIHVEHAIVGAKDCSVR